MANVLPVKAVRSGDTVTGLGEFQSGDTLDPAVLPGGSVAAHESALDPHSQYALESDLCNVDNTSDANKPVSAATQTALDAVTEAFAAQATALIQTQTIVVEHHAFQ